MPDQTVATLLQNLPVLEALVAIVYWTNVAKPFIERLTRRFTDEADVLEGSDFTRLFVSVLSVAVSFAMPAASIPMTLLQAATLAAFADGSYAVILKRFIEEEAALTAAAPPPPVIPPVQPLLPIVNEPGTPEGGK